MGLAPLFMEILFSLVLSACTAAVIITPADRNASNQTWYHDCCNPGLSAADKEMCKDAALDADHVLWDLDGNQFVYTWSDCKVGGEPWRKYE